MSVLLKLRLPSREVNHRTVVFSLHLSNFLFIIHYSLFIIHYVLLLFIVYCLLFVVYCLLFIVLCLLFIICYLFHFFICFIPFFYILSSEPAGVLRTGPSESRGQSEGVCASFSDTCCQRFQMTAAADPHNASLHNV